MLRTKTTGYTHRLLASLCVSIVSCLTLSNTSAQPGMPIAAVSKPFVLGVSDDLYSQVLGEPRTLNIYLPEGYNPQDVDTYPVVYLLDGSADEDFIHIAGLYQFNNFSWIDGAPKSIVVGIANVDRKRDFTFPTTVEEEASLYPTTGKSEAFIRFIETELQPYITSTYRANASSTLIGQSLGGLLATEILLKRPELFDTYIIVSPSLWWNDGSLLDASSEILQATFTRKTDIYIGVGKEGIVHSLTPHVMEVDANLLAEKISTSESEHVHVFFDYLPEENHATILHQAVFNAFRMLYPKK